MLGMLTVSSHDDTIEVGQMGSLKRPQADDYLFSISSVLNRIASDVRAAAGVTSAHQEIHISATDVSDMWAEPEDARIASVAQDLYNERRRRDRVFSCYPGAINDHTYDLLLYLFSARYFRHQVGVMSACHASGATSTTGLRHLARLVELGLVVRLDDPLDGRKQNVALTAQGTQKMREFLSGISRHSPPH